MGGFYVCMCKHGGGGLADNMISLFGVVLKPYCIGKIGKNMNHQCDKNWGYGLHNVPSGELR